MEVLRAKNISKSFGGLLALSDVSFELNKNETVSIIGPNGAGKTTLFNVISGFYRADKGEIHLNGEPIHHLRPDQICKLGLTRTFQIVQPFPDLSVLDNVIVGALARNPRLKKAEAKALEVLTLVEMGEKAQRIAKELTLAEKKHLELAKVLATDPKVLLMDEVMAGLTPAEAQQTIGIMKTLKKEGLDFILIEHVMEIVMSISDRVVVLNYGKKIAEGTPQEASSNPDVIEAYLGNEAYAQSG